MFTLEIQIDLSLLALVRDTSDETVPIAPVSCTRDYNDHFWPRYTLKRERDQVDWHKSGIPIRKTSQMMDSTDDAVTQSLRLITIQVIVSLQHCDLIKEMQHSAVGFWSQNAVQILVCHSELCDLRLLNWTYCTKTQLHQIIARIKWESKERARHSTLKNDDLLLE